MTYEETARFLNGALNYWPTLFRGNDPEAMSLPPGMGGGAV